MAGTFVDPGLKNPQKRHCERALALFSLVLETLAASAQELSDFDEMVVDGEDG